MYFIHRFWRLIPMFAALIVFAATIFPRLVTGPTDLEIPPPTYNLDENCRKYWWKSLLFINNFGNSLKIVCSFHIKNNFEKFLYI